MLYLFGAKSREMIKSEVDISKLGNISGLAAGNTEYLGVYFGEKKIGYVLNRTEKSGEKLIVSHKSELNVTVQGFRQKADIEGTAELTKDMLLSSFYFRLNTQNQEFIVTGKSEEKKLIITSNL
ncbi:MAG: hypothetical protein N3B13_09355, partial [Deltaproteobacteria bacterium]|nr:hypothetical protein [Deltaproteobacteria bacterium]